MTHQQGLAGWHMPQHYLHHSIDASSLRIGHWAGARARENAKATHATVTAQDSSAHAQVRTNSKCIHVFMQTALQICERCCIIAALGPNRPVCSSVLQGRLVHKYQRLES